MCTGIMYNQIMESDWQCLVGISRDYYSNMKKYF